MLTALKHLRRERFQSGGCNLTTLTRAALMMAAALAGIVRTTVAAPPSLDVPYAKVVPRLDGSPDDPAWKGAAVIPRLSLSLRPGAEDRRPLPTRVLLLWNEDALFVRFICRDDEVYAPYARHDDPLYQGDVVEVFLDPGGDGRQYVELQVSPDNVTLDKLFLLTAEPRSDVHGRLRDEVLTRNFWEFLDWSLPALQTAARRLGVDATAAGEPGWLVDIALPAEPLLRRLGLKKFQPRRLRANFLRYDWPLPSSGDGSRSLVALNWAPVMNGCPHISPRAMGLLNLQPRRAEAPRTPALRLAP